MGQFELVYTKSGANRGIVSDNGAIVDHLLYWITCRDLQEANYLLAVHQ